MGKSSQGTEEPSKKAHLTCFYTNANSLKNKRSELEGKINETRPDIIGVTEVWMKEAYVIQGYHPPIRHDRAEDHKGGGVLILVKEELEMVECTELNESPFEESVWCLVNLGKTKKVLIGNCYRSPNSTPQNNGHMFELLQKVRTVRANSLLIMGDFNFPSIKWEEGIVTGPSVSDAARFFDVAQDLFLYQHVNFSTWYREGCQPSILDLVFTDQEGMVDELLVGEPLGKSDHVTITWKYLYEDPKCSAGEDSRTTAPKYNYRKGKYPDMKAQLRVVNWCDMDEMNVEEAWIFIKKILGENVRAYVPTFKKMKSKPKAKWWTKELTKEVRRKYKIWKEYVKNRSTETYKKYAKQRNSTLAKIKKRRKEYENRIVASVREDPKVLYKYIRNQQTVKTKVGPLESSGKMTEDDHQVAELLQDFFQSVFVQEDDKNLPDFPDMVGVDEALTHISVDTAEVLKELKQLKTDKAAGPDEIPAILLNRCAEELAEPLRRFFQKTVEEGTIPEDWKKAKIAPIHKKGSKKKASNYRPVSLTSQVCKILERIIRKHLINHLDLYQLITPFQHGFVQKKSCQTNLLVALEDWTRALDEGHDLDIIYLDFQKAFDTVPHQRLLKKLSAYGVQGKVLRWIESFLVGRTQQVVVGNGTSRWGGVTSGVPQGSVLGPTLFIVYINELPRLVSSSIAIFADDTKLYRTIRDIGDEQALQDDLRTLDDWSQKWLLKFNADKCVVMHCGVTNPRANYTMKQTDGRERVLKETELERDLGVYVASTMKPTTHCQRAANRAMSALKLLRIAFEDLNVTNFRLLYTTYVRPHLDYCAQAVGPYMRQDFAALEKVQRRATKLVRGMKHLTYEQRLRRLKLMSMEKRVRRGDMIETFKILTGKLRIHSTHFFKKSQDDRTRGHSQKLEKARPRHYARSNFFSNRVVTSWNQLPETVVSAVSTNEFKNRLDKYWTA